MPPRLIATLRVLACFIFLAQPNLAAPHAATAPGFTLADVQAPRPMAADKDEDACGRGKATKRFGWKVVDFGVATLKYLVGLLIIPIGFFLVCVGAVLQAVELIAC